MSSEEEKAQLQREVEITRQQLSDTVDQIVRTMDRQVNPWVRTLREYRVPIALFALSLVLAIVERSRK